MKSLRNVLAILLLTSFSSVYAGSCFDEHDRDVDDCQLKSKQGDASAQYRLGLMYYDGTGVAQDHVMAHMFFNIAAAGGFKLAKKNRDIIAKNMTPSQIEKSTRFSRGMGANILAPY